MQLYIIGTKISNTKISNEHWKAQVLRSDGDLTDDKLNDGFKTIVFKYVREELVESQVRIGSMQSDVDSLSVRRSIQVLESLLADRD